MQMEFVERPKTDFKEQEHCVSKTIRESGRFYSDLWALFLIPSETYVLHFEEFEENPQLLITLYFGPLV